MMVWRPIKLIWSIIALIVIATAIVWGLSSVTPLLFAYITSLEDMFFKIMATALAIGGLFVLAFVTIKFMEKRAKELVEDIRNFKSEVVASIVESRTKKILLVCWISFAKPDILMPPHAKGNVAEKLIEIFRDEIPRLGLLAIPSQENPGEGRGGEGLKVGHIRVRRFYGLPIVFYPVVASVGPRGYEGHEGEGEVRVRG
jgi:hypothetical protein